MRDTVDTRTLLCCLVSYAAVIVSIWIAVSSDSKGCKCVWKPRQTYTLRCSPPIRVASACRRDRIALMIRTPCLYADTADCVPCNACIRIR